MAVEYATVSNNALIPATTQFQQHEMSMQLLNKLLIFYQVLSSCSNVLHSSLAYTHALCLFIRFNSNGEVGYSVQELL